MLTKTPENTMLLKHGEEHGEEHGFRKLQKTPCFSEGMMITEQQVPVGEGEVLLTKTPEKVINSNDTFIDNQNDTFPKLQNRLSNKDVTITEQQVPVGEREVLLTKTPEKAYNLNVGEFVGQNVGFPKLQKRPTNASDIDVREQQVPVGKREVLLTKTPEKVSDINTNRLPNQMTNLPKLQKRLVNNEGMITEQQVPVCEREILLTKTPEFGGNLNVPKIVPEIVPIRKFQNLGTNGSKTGNQEQQVPVYESVTLQSLDSLFSNTLKPNSYLSLPNLPKCYGAVRMWVQNLSV